MPSSEPIKTVYYTDSLNDEFSSAEITPKIIDENYRYISPNPFWKIGRFIAYRLIAMPIAFWYCKLALHSTFRNQQVLALYAFKSAAVFIPLIVLEIATGHLFPPGTALLANFMGSHTMKGIVFYEKTNLNYCRNRF